MSSEKFTPGPWHVETQKGFSENRFLIFDDPDENGEIDRVACTCFAEHETSLANAHLIATAPELYEALYGIVGDSTEHWQEVHVKKETINRAIHALKKARGEE